MNIFAVNDDPRQAANDLCDKHVVKMPLETAQILCTVANQKGYTAHYRSTHIHHPVIKWTNESIANWLWLTAHGLELCFEYTRRYNKIHKCQTIIETMSYDTNKIWSNSHTPEDILKKHTSFVQCMPDQYKCPDDPVLAYRKYYIGDKIRFAKWKKPANPPQWFLDMTQ